MQIKTKYCSGCHHTQKHIKIGRESVGENMGGAVRGIAAIVSLGLTEALTHRTYWKCMECGSITTSLN